MRQSEGDDYESEKEFTIFCDLAKGDFSKMIGFARFVCVKKSDQELLEDHCIFNMMGDNQDKIDRPCESSIPAFSK